mmetsp:Transcript_139029/g.346551  ORF Transcript_139029/g.346551 Transcript_139029/m.346551 type:complete len:301 (-) Transcript_139029:39-941(-)
MTIIWTSGDTDLIIFSHTWPRKLSAMKFFRLWFSCSAAWRPASAFRALDMAVASLSMPTIGPAFRTRSLAASGSARMAASLSSLRWFARAKIAVWSAPGGGVSRGFCILCSMRSCNFLDNSRKLCRSGLPLGPPPMRLKSGHISSRSDKQWATMLSAVPRGTSFLKSNGRNCTTGCAPSSSSSSSSSISSLACTSAFSSSGCCSCCCSFSCCSSCGAFCGQALGTKAALARWGLLDRFRAPHGPSPASKSLASSRALGPAASAAASPPASSCAYFAAAAILQSQPAAQGWKGGSAQGVRC